MFTSTRNALTTLTTAAMLAMSGASLAATSSNSGHHTLANPSAEGPGGNAKPRQTTTIWGVVYEPAEPGKAHGRRAANQPIEVISGLERRVIATTRTNAKGQFTIADLPGGDDYTVVAGTGTAQAYWWGHLAIGQSIKIAIDFDADLWNPATLD